jgi:hypothetical protein
MTYQPQQPPKTRRTVALSVAAAVAALSVAACGTSHGAAPTAPNPAVPGPQPILALPTKADLTATLPTLNDMPAGYTASDTSGDDSDSTSWTCKGATIGAKKADVGADVQYAGSGLTAAVYSARLGAYRAGAAKVFADTRTVLTSCPNIGSTDKKSTMTAQQASFPAVGDDRFALSLTASSGGIDINMTVVFVRVNRCVLMVIDGGLVGADMTTVESTTKATASKLAQVC